MGASDLYVLTVHEPYSSPEHPIPINGTVIHAKTLLHPRVPQPSGRLMYRALVDYPGREEGSLVPVSTLTSEVGGLLSALAPEWEGVIEAVVNLARSRDCDAMSLGLSSMHAALLAHGPNTQHTFFVVTSQELETHSAPSRQEVLDGIVQHLRVFVAQGPFWPGAGLLPA